MEGINSIVDARARTHQKVTFFGVVVELTLPRPSKGSDCYCTLKVVDETYQEGFVVNVFARSAHELPLVAALGDIVQFRRVMVKEHVGEINAVFYKDSSSFALYQRQQHAQGFNPYQSSENFRCPGPRDSESIARLTTWFVNFAPDEGLPTTLSALTGITEQAHLCFKVLCVHEYIQGKWVALVWDGTDCPSNAVEPMLEDESDNPMPLTIEPVPLPIDLLRTFPTIGTILRVMIEDDSKTPAIRLLNPGNWVKLYNMTIKVQAGLWYGSLTPFVKLHYTSGNNPFVLERERFHQDRLSEMQCVPSSSIIGSSRMTEINNDNARTGTLMDVITSSEMTAKFKCVARVIAMKPWHLKDIVCPLLLRLTLEDPTARIHAIVDKLDGRKFFWEHPSPEPLAWKLERLLGVTTEEDGSRIESPRDAPWIDVCLEWYYRDGTKEYRIFDTKMLV